MKNHNWTNIKNKNEQNNIKTKQNNIIYQVESKKIE